MENKLSGKEERGAKTGSDIFHTVSYHTSYDMISSKTNK